MFEFDEQMSKKDDAYHFVAYIPINGRLYELDGLRDGPLDHGSCDQKDWLKSVKPVVQKRINRYKVKENNIANFIACSSSLAMLLMKSISIFWLLYRKENVCTRGKSQNWKEKSN